MTQLVGILNITPDSFSDGNQYVRTEDALKHAELLFNAGASLVDIGAESTRPGATVLSHEQEWERLKDILPTLMNKYPGKVSLDTYHPETVERALEFGDIIINDVTGLNNPNMFATIVRLKPKIIVSHLPAKTVHVAHNDAPINDINTVKNDLLARARALEAQGMSRDTIILDPGIGFGKTMDLNEKLLTFPSLILEYPVMIGYSRKRFLGEQRMELEPNLAAGRIAIANGAAYLRVHDVAGHAQLINSKNAI